MTEPEEDETSWRDDLRVEVVHELLREVVSSTEVAELELPHIVVCRDEETGTVSYTGPFPDGLSAMVFAERETAVDREHGDDVPLTFVVAALYPTRRGVR